jgi:hypothetical protein
VADAKHLGIELLKPGDRPELVLGDRPELVLGTRPELVQGNRPELVLGDRPELVLANRKEEHRDTHKEPEEDRIEGRTYLLFFPHPMQAGTVTGSIPRTGEGERYR